MEATILTTFSTIAVIMIILMIIFSLTKKKGGSWGELKDVIHRWAMQKNFVYSEENQEAIIKRFDASPNKFFCNGRLYIKSAFSTFKGPYVEGVVNDRNMWLYRLNGTVIPNAAETGFKGFCIEFETNPIPVTLKVDYKKIYPGIVLSKDDVNTESGAFEKRYLVSVERGRGTLQLLEPQMIYLINESNFNIMEFSDSSVAVYFPTSKITLEVLDKVVEKAQKIAEQVDRNFPLGKYEKK